MNTINLPDIMVPVAHDWFINQCRNIYGAYYLYGRHARDHESIAVPIIAEDAPNSDWFLISCERISPAWSERQCLARISEWSRTAPILGQ